MRVIFSQIFSCDTIRVPSGALKVYTAPFLCQDSCQSMPLDGMSLTCFARTQRSYEGQSAGAVGTFEAETALLHT
jgi:hypothetical protein